MHARPYPCTGSDHRHNRPSDHRATNDNVHRASNHNHNPIWFSDGRNLRAGTAHR